MARTERRLFVAAFGVVMIAFLTCRPSTRLERLRDAEVSRLHHQIEEERAIESRLRRLQKGAPSAEVLREFGKPGLTAPCTSNDKQCWYYDLARQRYFVCLDEHGVVTCKGKVFIFPR